MRTEGAQTQKNYKQGSLIRCSRASRVRKYQVNTQLIQADSFKGQFFLLIKTCLASHPIYACSKMTPEIHDIYVTTNLMIISSSDITYNS